MSWWDDHFCLLLKKRSAQQYYLWLLIRITERTRVRKQLNSSTADGGIKFLLNLYSSLRMLFSILSLFFIHQFSFHYVRRILSAWFSTPCEKTVLFSFIENSFSRQKISTKKNLFLCQFDEVQQGRELAFFALLFIHTCAQLWLHFFGSLGYFRRLPPSIFSTKTH
jgi:hypothetical protein